MITLSQQLKKEIGFFATLSKKSSVPYNSGIFILVISVLMMLLGGFNTLTDMLVFVIWIFYTMTFFAVFILRKKEPKLIRPYKIPLYPFIPMIALLGGLFIVFNTLFTQPILALCGIGLTAIGLPIYFKMRHKHINVKREN
ncbi:Amino acid permease domain protein [Bacillus thuringiensis IBL 200]|nr:amino acid permease [Bacillus thuringiensis]EEM93052.1 Amino acid permease domain protein [Bacillus thuringiensis IBL 200]MBG9640708.1 amino acid permease [Bacillus thuringiensis]MBG9677051.1 amino acid permease [Bacillus thuringiensis]